jgi:hypothetical protein
MNNRSWWQMPKRVFVGFGFGAIRGGLFVYEAFRSGNFDRLVGTMRLVLDARVHTATVRARRDSRLGIDTGRHAR